VDQQTISSAPAPAVHLLFPLWLDGLWSSFPLSDVLAASLTCILMFSESKSLGFVFCPENVKSVLNRG